MKDILGELRRRRVFTSALLYVPFAWIATEVSTFLFDKFSLPLWANDLLAAAFVAGFPAFIVLAWTFDVGPDGIRRTSATPAQGYAAILLALLIMVAGATGLFYQIQSRLSDTAVRNVQVAKPSPATNSIAVYAFENLSSDPENAYFAEGMTSELITRLSQIEGLQIAALAQTKEEVLAFGLEPDVSYRLEGAIRKAGNRVRIAALLTDRASGFTVWSEEFDGDLEDVFALQERTALRIAQALDVKLSPQESIAQSARETDNTAAYDVFLRGWSLIESLHLSLEGAEGKLTTARGHFQEALSLDPGYTRAIAGLSMVESYSVFLGMDPEDHLPQAREFAEDALSRDDSLRESHFAMAKALAISRDISGALAEYRKVVELDPQNGYAWCEMSGVLNSEDPVGAESAARKAIRFRPTYSSAYYNLGAALQKQDRTSEAIEAYQQSLQLNPANRSLQKTIELLQGALLE